MKMRKLVAMLLAVLMLCSIIPFSAVAAGTSAKIDFTDKANRTAYSTEQQVWEQNGIVVTNDKGASTSNVGDYGGDGYPARFYKSSTVKIDYPGMTKIEINCTGLESKYVSGWADSVADANATATNDGNIVTIVFEKAVDSFTWDKLSAQSRAYDITVYTGDAGDTPVTPDPEPDVPVTPADPEADTELSIADAIALGASKEHNAYTESKYYVTGVITEVYNTQYGNMKITDNAGNILTIYGTYSADGTVRYDALEVKPVAGDTVKVYGIIGQYNGTAQVKNGWIVEHTAAGDTPVTPDPEPDVPAVGGVVDNPVAGVAYKFGMIQGNVSATDVYYLIGGMNGYYMATGKDVAAAIDVYLEATTGGYYLYAMVDGAKTYINMVVSGTHVNGAYEATASTVYTYDADAKTVVAMAQPDGAEAAEAYWFGTRNDKTYTTVGPCAVSFEGFYCQFYAVGGDTPVDPEPDVPGDDPVDPDDDIDTTIPYLFGMVQENVSTEDVYFLAGGMSGYYMATTTDVDAAILVYLEKTSGGYYLYTMDGDSKLYINMVVSGTYVNGAYEAAASTVYTYDLELGTLVSTVNGDIYAFGTRNDKTYTTVGPVKVSYNGFHMDLYFTEGACDHEFDELIMYPTCSTEGEKYAVCIHCGYNYFVETIPATGEHVYDNDADADCNVCGAIREIDQPDQPGVAGGSVDFNTIVTPNANGDSSYKNTYTTESGWVTENSAIQGGGASVSNPQFPVIGPDSTYKAVCLNGKTSAPGKLTSPVLTGGISKLTMDYTKMFTDTQLSVIITITDITTGAVYTQTVFREESKDTKYEIWTYEWVLETAITGDFTIEVLNACPTGQDGNKDRFTILDLSWEGAANTPVNPDPDQPIEYDGTIEVSTVEGVIGETVTVTVTLPNNPGIISAKVKVHYDATVLKLVAYEAGNFSAGGYSWGDMTKDYFIINWCDAINPDSTADLLATLTFEILADATEGFTAITLEYSCEDDMFNAADDTVWFEAVHGGVQLVAVTIIPGDANGDGKVNNRDLGILQQYLNEWDVTVDDKASDVNGDGKVNNRDLGVLQQLLNA